MDKTDNVNDMIKKGNTDMDFEAAVKRLDEIAVLLEREGVSLEESLALYEEGVRLVRVCNEKLENAQRRISVLRMNQDGELTEDNFSMQS